MSTLHTILSAGMLLRHLLLQNELIRTRATAIFPVAGTDVTLPYIVYRRSAATSDPVKRFTPPRTAEIEFEIYSASYSEGVELAEAVLDTLDNARGELGELTLRSCLLVASEEGIVDDAWMQSLTFSVKV